MEHKKLEYKVVMGDGLDSEVLGRLRDLEFVGAVYMAAVAKYPKRNVYLRQGAHIIRQNLGEPKPEPPPDPALRDWNVSLIRGSKMDFRGHRHGMRFGISHGGGDRSVQSECGTGES